MFATSKNMLPHLELLIDASLVGILLHLDVSPLKIVLERGIPVK